MLRLALPLLALLVACPGPSPAPVVPTPDASDAASPPFTGGSPDCAAACAAMVVAGCVVQSNCAAILTADTAARRIRNAKTGQALTCQDLAAAKTAADIQAVGQACGP